MGWQTIVSDGTLVGNISVIANYAKRNTGSYKEEPAKIDNIKEYFEDNRFDDYRIENEGLGGASLIIRKTLEPMIYSILDVPESEPLEGRVVTAIWEGELLAGFKAPNQ
jgi:hypothetical protein